MAKTWGDFEIALRSGAPIREFLPTYLTNAKTVDASKSPKHAIGNNNADGKQSLNNLYENVGVLGDDVLRMHYGRADVSCINSIFLQNMLELAFPPVTTLTDFGDICSTRKEANTAICDGTII